MQVNINDVKFWLPAAFFEFHCEQGVLYRVCQSYLPGVEVNRDHVGGSSRSRPFHCTSAGLTPTITPNVGNSNASFLLVGDCVRAIPWVKRSDVTFDLKWILHGKEPRLLMHATDIWLVNDFHRVHETKGSYLQYHCKIISSHTLPPSIQQVSWAKQYLARITRLNLARHRHCTGRLLSHLWFQV